MRPSFQLLKLLTGEVDKVNKMVSGEGAYTFYSPIFGNDIGMNFTMTSAPQLIGSTDLAKIFFDGLFILPENSTHKPIIDFHQNLKNYPAREEHSLSQQFWLNQDIFNSLMEIHPTTLFPQNFNSSDVSAALYKAFPTLKTVCSGAPTWVSYNLHKSSSAQSESITFDMHKGIVLGGKNNDVRSDVDIYCTGSTSPVYSFSA